MEDLPIRHSLRSLVGFLLQALATGTVTGVLIFLFKYLAGTVSGLSAHAYSFIRANPVFLPLLILGAAALGVLLCLILKLSPDCKGGGIPSSIALLRGLWSFSWVKSLFFTFPAAFLTYLCGVPLGNEGPSVQIGTATGRACSRLCGKKQPAWDRYLMTGGACAGFAAATGAPISGIFFAFEEAHRRFSPLIFMAASLTVIGATASSQILCALTQTSPSLFHFSPEHSLPVFYLWAPVAVGLVCALGAWLFTKCYGVVRRLLKHTTARISPFVKIPVIFAAVALIGFFLPEVLGSGHSLVDTLFEGEGIGALLLLVLLLRALLLIVANNADVTGGLFVPTLALGAALGALCGKALILLGLLPEEHLLLMTILGIASFMSASSRTPIIAVTFAVEALGCFDNVLPITVGVAVSFVVIEILGIPGFTDTVIAAKIDQEHTGKTPRMMELTLEVQKDSFADGKEIRDIFWPPACTVLSIHKNTKRHHGQQMDEGDELHLVCRSYDPRETEHLLEAILGPQKEGAFSAQSDASEDEIPEY